MTWQVRSARVLTCAEIRSVLFELHRKSRRSLMTRRALVVFRLACCCGLRASELCQLTLEDVRPNCQRPVIEVRKEVGKGGRARTVPLWGGGGRLGGFRGWQGGGGG